MEDTKENNIEYSPRCHSKRFKTPEEVVENHIKVVSAGKLCYLVTPPPKNLLFQNRFSHYPFSK